MLDPISEQITQRDFMAAMPGKIHPSFPSICTYLPLTIYSDEDQGDYTVDDFNMDDFFMPTTFDEQYPGFDLE